MKSTVKISIAGLILLCLLPAGASSAQDLDENAALYYWEALALMRQPDSVEEFAVLDFIRNDLPQLPPSILTANTDAAQWLMGDRAMLAALAKAGRCRRCEFFVRSPADPFPALVHLAPMRVLTDRALAVAKAYEFARNSEGAAMIYRDLLLLVRNLDRDITMRSGLVAADMLQQILFDLEGFLSREPGREAATILSNAFLQSPRPLFHPADYLRMEAVSFRQWMLADPRQMEQKLVRLYGGAAESPAIIRLMALDTPRKVLQMGTWIMDYEAWMLRLANECEAPYERAIGALRWSDAEKVRIEKEASESGGNPLFSLSIPSMSAAYERFLAAEGQFSMAAVLSAAVLYFNDFGRWPVSLDEVSMAAAGPLPRDPFSGQDFFYKTSRLLPRVMLRVPKTMIDEGSILYRMDIRARREQDEKQFQQALKNLEKKWRATAVRAALEVENSPVPGTPRK
ncbi:MAG TPA: hypothetical protein PKM67_10185 [Kiritimatiellia bacterium]|nr:hypothetical protein [Kiritimatiellia bacterium]HNS81812.1 hypothetical protein [Kiritimatiellia bacterium]HPA78268.1 hypothetical protein [Kiritimatiellia bacterium]HQQ04744.1 hypothetical protein [Kiritimatiellia bacterium]